ncbi:MAG TPA: DNA-binding response regulator [Desulfotomaculum sp.]|nr:MAG: transcriptional regulator [Peptococcaceae bacterium BRH_c8a]KJS71321.1 MAG: transcriptional regulator [Desulfotomaculum sp. BICA1-6]HBX23627.1 DNA-binding response regulator [Desulfotomaculum sp.]
MSYRVYLVEDEKNLNRVLTSYLEKEGWQVQSFTDGHQAHQAIDQRPHLWILDIMLPGLDGYQLLREIKAGDHQMPVIFISARDEDIDRIVGLEMGSDDYLPKPFLPRELVIRTRKLLERVYGPTANASKEPARQVFDWGSYHIDTQSRTVSDNGCLLELTAKEFDLLLFLGCNLGQALDREQVLRHVWSADYFGSDRVVDDLVRRLRKKMPNLRLETLYGYGYRLVKP